MTYTYNTGNPLGSTAPKDLFDNASNFDEAMNSTSPSFDDRFGKRRQTWAGAEYEWQQFLANSGYESIPLVYTDGSPLVVARPTQLIQRAGLLYRVQLPASFPVTLSGTWATDAPLLVQAVDGALKADLSNTAAVDKGAAMIGRGAQVVPSIAALKALLKTTPSKHAFVTGFYTQGDGGGGAYYLDTADTTSIEVPGIVVVATDGGRWKLVEGSPIFAETCGAKGDGITDDSQAIKTAIAYVSSRNGGNVRFLPRVYCISETLLVNTSAVGLVGSGAESYITGDFGTLLRWIGTVTANMVEFAQVDCPVFSGIKLDCANQAFGLRASGVKYGKFTNFAIRDFVTVGFYGLCGAVPGQWSSGNHVQQFLITSSNPGVSGLLLDGDAAANNDWFNNTFINGTIQVSRTTPQSFAAHLAFCDSNTFIEVDFTDGAGSGTAEGVLFNSGTRTAFPTNNNFVSCSMTSAVAYEPVGTEIGTNYMQLYPTKDGEVLPTHPKLIGTTDDGQFFGPNLWLRHDFGRIRLAPHSADRSYDILLNGSDSVDAGIQIIRRAAGADTVYLQIDQTGAIYIFIPGVGLRQILSGAADSGGSGYRMLRVAN